MAKRVSAVMAGSRRRVGGERPLRALIGSGLALAACAGPSRTHPEPQLAAGQESVSASRPAKSVEFCTETVTEFDAHRCAHSLTPAEQRARSFSWEIGRKGGRVVTFAKRSGHGRLLESDGGCAESMYRWGHGRAVDVRCNDLAGNLRSAWRTDEDGRYAMWYDAWGRPSFEVGSEAAGLLRTLDARGRVLSFAYVDAERRPTTDDRGVHLVRPKRDTAGHLLEERYFGLAGEPALALAGYHTVRFTLTPMGGVSAKCYFGLKDEPVVDRKGIHCFRFVFDRVGNWLEESWHGLEGEAVVHPMPKAAKAVVVRDGYGGEVQRAYFDPSGKPVMSRWHYATRKTTLDRRGRTVRWEQFGPDGRAAAVPDEPPIMETTYDEYDRVRENRSMNADGTPFIGERKWWIARHTRDSRGNDLKLEFLGADRRPVETWAYDYDGFGNRVREVDYDATGAPLREASATFDARGRMHEQKWYDHEGRPLHRGYIETIDFHCGSSRLTCADAERLANALARAVSAGAKASKWLEALFGSDDEPALGAQLEGSWIQDAAIDSFPINSARVRKTEEGFRVFVRSK